MNTGTTRKRNETKRTSQFADDRIARRRDLGRRDDARLLINVACSIEEKNFETNETNERSHAPVDGVVAEVPTSAVDADDVSDVASFDNSAAAAAVLVDASAAFYKRCVIIVK